MRRGEASTSSTDPIRKLQEAVYPQILSNQRRSCIPLNSLLQRNPLVTRDRTDSHSSHPCSDKIDTHKGIHVHLKHDEKRGGIYASYRHPIRKTARKLYTPQLLQRNPLVTRGAGMGEEGRGHSPLPSNRLRGGMETSYWTRWSGEGKPCC
ncbi:hypothetical protein TNIN_418161 [Trichonephila inaurata madagascariensis]|uniref:Uncharacterized protein n=1 Tax=Trichonephila inaurata madagascariensis TaxID=2747483 RepID=A0A8X6XXI3_9ARAC|nr:hypothetical protein TNIN_418161 [Trichonephila inaurata madagascariensis]